MNKRQLLCEMTRQLYEDCRYIAEHNSTQPVDEDGCSMFNTLLQELQAEYPECDLLLKFRELPARSVKFKDAVLIVGQLNRISTFLIDGLPGMNGGSEASSGLKKSSQTASSTQARWPVPPSSGKAPTPGLSGQASQTSSTAGRSASGAAGATGTSASRSAPTGQTGHDADDFRSFHNNNEFRVSFKDLD